MQIKYDVQYVDRFPIIFVNLVWYLYLFVRAILYTIQILILEHIFYVKNNFSSNILIDHFSSLGFQIAIVSCITY